MTKHYLILQTKELIDSKFGGNIRTRVCGVCKLNNQYLLANHHGINELGDFWCAPGGGLHFGESIQDGLKREFLEECSLEIEVGDFLNIFEFIQPPLHAIELFYEVKMVKGDLKLGYDPETGNKILKEVKWMDLGAIERLKKEEIHSFFHPLLRMY
ncbi:MAG: NUDIX hydrolase [Bacteroidota bacterium]